MRKELTFTADKGRDKGKVFLITEMPADRAERWAMRAFFAMAQNGIELPAGMDSAGMAGLARDGLRLICQIPFDVAEHLLEEMFECISIKPDRKNPQLVRPLVADDIEEVATRLKLRMEIFKLHVDFSSADE